MDLVDRQASLDDIKEYFCSTCNNYNGIKCRACCIDDTIELIENTPTVEAVPCDIHNDVCDQIMWERDVAMSQLEEYGIPFGGIAPDVVKVVRCKNCTNWARNVGVSDSPNGICFCHDICTNGEDYCSYGEGEAYK